MPRILTTQELADELRVSTRKVLRWLANGTITPIDSTKKRYFTFDLDTVRAQLIAANEPLPHPPMKISFTNEITEGGEAYERLRDYANRNDYDVDTAIIALIEQAEGRTAKPSAGVRSLKTVNLYLTESEYDELLDFHTNHRSDATISDTLAMMVKMFLSEMAHETDQSATTP